MSLNVNYMGLELSSPVLAASSPFTASIDRLMKLEEQGAGAVVLKSIFEEQIKGEAAFLEQYNDYPEAADYLQEYLASDYLKGHLNLIREAKSKLGIPVIASINCQAAGTWTEYAKSIEEAGADALELNIFILPTDPDMSSDDLEQKYLDIVGSITSIVSIPVSVKLSMRFTNVTHLCKQLYYRGAKGIVMFNRFFEPDIDIDNMTLIGSDSLSRASELRNNLRMVGICSSKVPSLNISVSTGVHTGADIVKSILAGARTVQVCSAISINGMGIINDMNCFLAEWMESHSFTTIDEFSGKLTYNSMGNEDFYQRSQYMKFFPGK